MPNKTEISKSDIELIEGLINRESSSFEEIFNKYSPLVLTLLKELNVTEEKTEEILIACFINISNNIQEFDSTKQRLFTWILQKVKITITEVCKEEKNNLEIQNRINFVKSHKDCLDPSLIRLFILHGGNIDELAQLNGVSRQELMVIIRNNINQMKK